MPEISHFLGIIIFMNFNDHNPPHFHARYGDYQMTIEIETGIIEGKFPPRSMKLVQEWRELHIDELLNIWNSITTTGEFQKIQGLE